MMRRHTARAFPSLVLLMLVAIAAGAALAQVGPAVPFVTVAEGRTSGVHEPAQVVIRDQATWLALWRRHMGTVDGPFPVINFSRDMVIAIFGGESSEQRKVTIRRIVREPDRLEVSYTLVAIRPLPNAEEVVPTFPFQIVRLARSPLPVRFVQVKAPQVD